MQHVKCWSRVSWVEIKYPKNVPYAQKVFFSQILCTNLFTSLVRTMIMHINCPGAMPPCTKRGPYRNGLSRSVWNNLTGLHRTLTSTELNTFGLNWNADCEPGLITKHQCPTSLMLLWHNGSKSPQKCSNI